MKTDNPDIHRLDERTRGISASMDVLFGAAEKDRDSIRGRVDTNAKRISELERENEELRTELKLFRAKFDSGTAVKVAAISAAASVIAAIVGLAVHFIGG